MKLSCRGGEELMLIYSVDCFDKLIDVIFTAEKKSCARCGSLRGSCLLSRGESTWGHVIIQNQKRRDEKAQMSEEQ